MRYLIGSLCVAILLFTGCDGTPLTNFSSRQAVTNHIAVITQLDVRVDRIIREINILGQGENRENANELKQMLDVYYVYYLTAHVSLAYGEINHYMQLIELGRDQLFAIEDRLETTADDTTKHGIGWVPISGTKQL